MWTRITATMWDDGLGNVVRFTGSWWDAFSMEHGRLTLVGAFRNREQAQRLAEGPSGGDPVLGWETGRPA